MIDFRNLLCFVACGWRVWVKAGCLLQPGVTTQGQCEITQLCSVPALTFWTESSNAGPVQRPDTNSSPWNIWSLGALSGKRRFRHGREGEGTFSMLPLLTYQNLCLLSTSWRCFRTFVFLHDHTSCVTSWKQAPCFSSLYFLATWMVWSIMYRHYALYSWLIFFWSSTGKEKCHPVVKEWGLKSLCPLKLMPLP